MYCVDTANTTITLYIKNLKMFGLETNFESTRPISQHVETKTIRLSSRPRPQKSVSRPRPVSRPTSLALTLLRSFENSCLSQELFVTHSSVSNRIIASSENEKQGLVMQIAHSDVCKAVVYFGQLNVTKIRGLD